MEDHCKAINLIIHKGRVGEVYNVGAHNEMRNIDIVKLICRELQKPESVDSSKIRNDLGWKPETGLKEGIRKTIRWYLDNREWWEALCTTI